MATSASYIQTTNLFNRL